MGKPILTIYSQSSSARLGINRKDITLLNKIGLVKRTRGTETSQYLEEKTSTEIPAVVASEPGGGQWSFVCELNGLESPARAGDSPVGGSAQKILE